MGEPEERPSVNEVRDAVAKIEDQNELEAMLEGEDRPGARKAIEKQLEAVRKPAPARNDETVYTAAELVAGAAAFGTTAAGMTGALHLAGNPDELTKSQAEDVVKTFNEREV